VLNRQLLVYRFAPGVSFEGQLVGALERAESGGAIRILDALLLAREPDSGALVAAALEGGTGGVLSQLLDFRLNPAARGTSTERVLAGPKAELVELLGRTIEPGGAVAALLVEHVWAAALGDAVNRLGGSEAAIALVEADGLADVTHLLIAAAEQDQPG
jgi:hypothetical protein